MSKTPKHEQDREDRVELTMEAMNVSRAEAELIVAFERGETTGDLVVVDEPEAAPTPTD